MPLITIELVVDGASLPGRDLAQSLADALGRVLGSAPGHTWVRLRTLDRHEYAENQSRIEDPDLPVFVTVLERRPPTGADLQAIVTTLTRAVAQVTARPAERVHVEYAPAAAGRLSFGGQVVE